MGIKIFRCGLCKSKNRGGMTRKGLRKHLREEHRIMTEITNSSMGKQKWWIEEET